MAKLLELIAKYGGAGGLIAALCVYLLCTQAIGANKKGTDKSFDLLEYRLQVLEQERAEHKAQFAEIQGSLMTLSVKLSKVEATLDAAVIRRRN